MEDLELTFWSGKRVLLTGHTGFKGGWLALWLYRLGAQLTGIGLGPATEPNLYQLAGIMDLCDSHIQDVRDAEGLAERVRRADPEVVFHLAAQPLVRASYRDPLGTFATNIQGTANLLNALRGLPSLRVVVAITTDKVYRNNEQPFPYRETDPLGGHDPYSASKAAAELVIASYRAAFLSEQGVAVATARAGNVIGGGDWSEDRLIPDAVRAWSSETPLQVRRPEATRPWQHVLEPLNGYLRLAEQLWHQPALADAYNFGPATHEAASVRQVISQARDLFQRGEIQWRDGTQGPHEAGWLALEIAKARQCLGVHPRWTLQESLQRTMHWYRRQADGESAGELCAQDIAAFQAAASSRRNA
ncbi:CDP-glucose 4,6-dehydratase [Lamprobacter modestohalophilus]|uniref:CDP-glucose 4,6-dehydratase n=1 Tax=Lamprobacter modestohalophilus TaxID=1064514 RepID=A0A9X0WDA0_9GAMM|nr:CDP-glucose 4,6-dehydratase [Lamprobacter modestohalophilus]MBK1621334.1 CDP-glucose 4,6-dehydratase [Lamprobacter modestohalophilus]